MDCGEGIHLMAADHSIVQNNESELNSGGILISDETGPSNDNFIAGNQVHDNAFACGITMASRPLVPGSASKLPYGVYRNTIQANVSTQHDLREQGNR